MLHSPLAARPAWPRCAIAQSVVADVSRYFESLLTPAQFEELLEKAPSDAVSIIKFQATYCRTRSARDGAAARPRGEEVSDAKFYDLTLARDGKAAGERMYRFFKSRGIKERRTSRCNPGERVEAEVVVPSGIERLQQMIAARRSG